MHGKYLNVYFFSYLSCVSRSKLFFVLCKNTHEVSVSTVDKKHTYFVRVSALI